VSHAAPRRFGILGGSFDPVHLGHLALARAALERLELDELRWMPAGAPWQKKQPSASGEHRVAMLELALGDAPRQQIDPRELTRLGPTYTVDTLDELERELPEVHWHLVIGQDQFARLHTWHRWRDLIDRVTLAVVARDGVAPRTSPEVESVGPSVQVIPMPPVDVSSTLIRQRLLDGLGIEHLVPAAVARYIERHGLYSGADPHGHDWGPTGPEAAKG
jgi:nicotinate-nucleotide adenylyltransferase